MTLACALFTTFFSIPEPENFGTMTLSLKSLFDAFIGNWDYTENPNYIMSFSIIMMLHVFLSNIFLMNYLIAILSTVYTIMREEGEFSYKKKKYQFIEKYSIPLLDKHGYAELVIHPPPFNAFTIFLTPFAVHRKAMKAVGGCFGKVIYWVENFFYIIGFFIYEWILVPFIFLKVFFNIIRLAGILMFLPLLLVWILVGPFLLIFDVLKDTGYFIATLCNYQIKNDQSRAMDEEEFKTDKIIILNEIIDVMRQIMHLFRQKK